MWYEYPMICYRELWRKLEMTSCEFAALTIHYKSRCFNVHVHVRGLDVCFTFEMLINFFLYIIISFCESKWKFFFCSFWSLECFFPSCSTHFRYEIWELTNKKRSFRTIFGKIKSKRKFSLVVYCESVISKSQIKKCYALFLIQFQIRCEKKHVHKENERSEWRRLVGRRRRKQITVDMLQSHKSLNWNSTNTRLHIFICILLPLLLIQWLFLWIVDLLLLLWLFLSLSLSQSLTHLFRTELSLSSSTTSIPPHWHLLFTLLVGIIG